MQYTAKLKYLKMAPRKVRLMASALKGMPVNEAEAQLLLHSRRAAKPLLKLLRSAIANAKNRKQDPGRLFIAAINVDQGPMLKRFMPRARGSASPIQKKMSHVSILLKESETPRQSRFSIIPPQKGKTGNKLKLKEKTKREGAAPEEKYQKPIQEKPGFFRRVFRRKSV